MAKNQIQHGFKVVARGDDGKPLIFVHSFFPDQIVEMKPLSPSGTRLTVKYNQDAAPMTWNVMPNVETIENMMSQCRVLDDERKHGTSSSGQPYG